jgi:hypothetical protein
VDAAGTADDGRAGTLGKTNELLRARLVERGWSHDNPKGLPRTISPAADFAIVATTGDAVTGYPGGSPSTKYAKGIQTVRAIGRNFHQLAFDLPDLFAGEDRWDAGDDPATWLLLYHVTPIRSGPNCRSPTALTDGATSASGLSGSSCLLFEQTNAR